MSASLQDNELLKKMGAFHILPGRGRTLADLQVRRWGGCVGGWVRALEGAWEQGQRSVLLCAACYYPVDWLPLSKWLPQVLFTLHAHLSNPLACRRSTAQPCPPHLRSITSLSASCPPRLPRLVLVVAPAQAHTWAPPRMCARAGFGGCRQRQQKNAAAAGTMVA